MGPHEYRFVNLFRALAAFWVLAAHSQIWGGYRWLPIPDPKIAVDLFMLVSGFLMAANAAARWEREPLDQPSARLRFWVRRYFRIAPAYYLALAVVIIGAPIFLPGKAHLQSLDPAHWAGTIYDPALVNFSPENVLMHLSFLFGLHPGYASSTSLPDWSLGLEMQFYLAFPLLTIWLRTTWRMLAFGLAAFIAGRAIDIFLAFPEPSFLLLKLNYFLSGMLLFRALASERRIGPVVAAVALASLGFEYGQQWLPPALLLSMLALGLLERNRETPRWLAAVIDGKAVRFASDVSYSVYLFHGMAIGAFGALLARFGDVSAPARTLALFALVAPMSYAIGFAVYRLVEMPGINIGRRLLTGQRAVVNDCERSA